METKAVRKDIKESKFSLPVSSLEMNDDYDHGAIKEAYAKLDALPVGPASASAAPGKERTILIPSTAASPASNIDALITKITAGNSPHPELLIEAIQTKNVASIIALTNIPKIKSWLNIAYNGKTAGYYALHPLNLPLLKRLLNCGLDPEQPMAVNNEDLVTQPWRAQGLLNLIAEQPLSVRKAVLALLKEHYGPRFSSIIIDNEALPVWEYELEKMEAPGQPEDNASNLLKQLIQLMKEQSYTASVSIDKLLVQMEALKLPVWPIVYDDNGEDVFTVAATHGHPEYVDKLIPILGLDVSKSTPHLLQTIQRWMAKENFGMGHTMLLGAYLRLVEVLLKHYGDQAVFTPWPLSRWKLQFDSHYQLLWKSKLYRCIHAKNYDRALEDLTDSSVEFMYDPFSSPLLHRYRGMTFHNGDFSLETPPSLYALILKDLTTEQDQVQLRLIKRTLFALIDKLSSSPTKLNQLLRGKSLLHHLAELPDTNSKEFIGALCSKPGIEVNLMDGNNYPPLYYALLRGNWPAAKKLRDFGADLGPAWVKKLPKSIELIDGLFDLDINPFALTRLDDMTYTHRRTLPFEPTWQIDMRNPENYKKYVSKMLEVTVPDNINKFLDDYLAPLLEYYGNFSAEIKALLTETIRALTTVANVQMTVKWLDKREKHSLSFWVMTFAKQFNWTERDLEPIVYLMIIKKVNIAHFKERAKEYPPLARILEKCRQEDKNSASRPAMALRGNITAPTGPAAMFGNIDNPQKADAKKGDAKIQHQPTAASDAEMPPPDIMPAPSSSSSTSSPQR